MLFTHFLGELLVKYIRVPEVFNTLKYSSFGIVSIGIFYNGLGEFKVS